ncbi:MAG: hypothetical protein EBX98_00195, partial [Burkholderiaceae bacterium]|nr:hypothetical protein [Burkholderiaceae bacterium]
MLLTECQKGDVTVHHPVSVTHISQTQSHWSLETTDGIKKATHLIIATGGLPVPAIGASDFGLQIAKQFEIPTTSVRPALVPLSFTSNEFSAFTSLAGISIEASVQAGQRNQSYGTYRFDEDLLFTHKGLSGPAILQASSYWHEGEPITINWLGKTDFDQLFSEEVNQKVSAPPIVVETYEKKGKTLPLLMIQGYELTAEGSNKTILIRDAMVKLLGQKIAEFGF